MTVWPVDTDKSRSDLHDIKVWPGGWLSVNHPRLTFELRNYHFPFITLSFTFMVFCQHPWQPALSPWRHATTSRPRSTCFSAMTERVFNLPYSQTRQIRSNAWFYMSCMRCRRRLWKWTRRERILAICLVRLSTQCQRDAISLNRQLGHLLTQAK